jgi:hypothetical protein
MLLPSWLRWLTGGFAGKRAGSTQPSAALRRRRLTLEQLEDRTLPSSYTAASVSDLIADITAANKYGGSNTIVLTAPTTSPYVLTSPSGNNQGGSTGLPAINNGDNLTIVGNGAIIERSTASGTQAFRLFNVASGGALTLEKLTLENGRAFGSGAGAQGGAIYNQGTLLLDGVTVQSNVAQGTSGAAGTGSHRSGGDGQEAAGGGIWSSGTLTLQNGTAVQNNQTLGGNGGDGANSLRGPYESKGSEGPGGNGAEAFGGGIYVAGGTLSLTSATLSSNTALGGGGGSGNFAGSGASGLGGGLYVAGGTVNLTSVTLSGNTAQGNGGGISPIGFGGSGPGLGGGLYVAGGIVSVDSVTVENNTVTGGYFGGEGGGLYLAGGTVTLCSDTVANNTATGGSGLGGGLFIDAGATVYLDTQTKVVNNTAASSPDIDGSYTLQTC